MIRKTVQFDTEFTTITATSAGKGCFLLHIATSKKTAPDFVNEETEGAIFLEKSDADNFIALLQEFNK